MSGFLMSIPTLSDDIDSRDLGQARTIQGTGSRPVLVISVAGNRNIYFTYDDGRPVASSANYFFKKRFRKTKFFADRICHIGAISVPYAYGTLKPCLFIDLPTYLPYVLSLSFN